MHEYIICYYSENEACIILTTCTDPVLAVASYDSSVLQSTNSEDDVQRSLGPQQPPKGILPLVRRKVAKYAAVFMCVCIHLIT